MKPFDLSINLLSARTVLLSALLFYGCTDNGDEFDNQEVISELDDLLLQVNPAGREFFLLPEDGDFSDLPQDPRNPITAEKVALGKMLFHETALATESRNLIGQKTYSCSSCHNANAAMQSGRRQGMAEGGMGFGISGDGRNANPDYNIEDLDVQPIRAPSTLNVAYQKNLLWNGMFGATGDNIGTEDKWTGDASVNLLGFEGAESQAIKGLEVHRMKSDPDMMNDMGYMDMLAAAFPGVSGDTLASRVYMGLSIGAYVRTITSSQAPFQRWLRGDNEAMTEQQIRGAMLFFGPANCVSCHSGPGLNNMEFSAVGMDDLTGDDIFKQDDVNTPLGRASFTGNPEDNYKFKVPQLYNLRDAPFYGHGSSMEDLEDVVSYFNTAVPEKDLPTSSLDDRFVPLGLTDAEITDLTIF